MIIEYLVKHPTNTKNASLFPILDRINIYIESPRVDYERLTGAWGDISVYSCQCHILAVALQYRPQLM